MLKIKRGLEADAILNGAGNEKWHTSNINQILRNEKFVGDALLQKTYTTDFLTKTRVKNHGVVPQYYVENSHEAIITLQKNIETLIYHESSHTLTAIDKRLTELQSELLKLASSKADYEKVGNEIYRLRDKKQKVQVENINRDEVKKRIADMLFMVIKIEYYKSTCPIW